MYEMKLEARNGEIGKKTSFWIIDKRLLPVKVHYFLFMAALSCVLPFRTVFAKQLGISPTAIGVIFLAIPVIKTVTNPLFGFLVDYFKGYRWTLVLLMSVVAVTNVALLFVPPLTNEAQENFTDQINPKTYIRYDCSKGSAFYFHAHSVVKSNAYSALECEVTCDGSFLSKSYGVPEKMNGMCSGRFSLQSKVTFTRNGCNLEHSLSLPSDVMFRNSSPTIVLIEESVQLSKSNVKEIHDKRNCSKSFTGLAYNSVINGTNDASTLVNTTKLSSEPVDGSIIENQLYFFATTFTEDEMPVSGDQVCPCKHWLTCVTFNCSTDNDFEVRQKPDDFFLTFQFWSLFVLFFLSSVCFAAVSFLVDAVSYEMMAERRELYGLQRLWGTIGWGLGALAGGYFNEIITTDSSRVDYSLSFYLLAVLIVMDFIPVSQFKVEDVKYSSNICKDVIILLSNARIFAYVLMTCGIGVLSGLLWNYQFWFMEEIGASQGLLGLSQTVECLLSEVPCFIVSGWVIKKIGYLNCNSLTLLCFGLRYLCFAYMHNPWMMLPVGILQGPTFGIFYAAMTMFGKTEAPPGTEATVQSIFAVSFEGVGVGLGSILGGIGFEKFGSRMTFIYMSIFSLVLLVANVTLHFTIWRKEPKKEHSLKLKVAATEDTSNF